MSGTINTSATGGYVVDQPPKPATTEDFERALQQMASILTGLPGNLVRPRWQPVPPTQPPADVTWMAIGINMIETDDYPYIKHLGNVTLPGAKGPGADLMQRHGTVTALATFYGPEADTVAGQFRDALYIPQNYEPIVGIRMKLRTVHDLARVPELINQQWINRVDMRAEFRVQMDRLYPILNLDGAQVNIRHDDGTDDLPITVYDGTYWDDFQTVWDNGLTTWDKP